MQDVGSFYNQQDLINFEPINIIKIHLMNKTM